MIKGKIDGQSLTVSTPLVVADTIDYLTAEFEFSDDWDGADKWAHFAHRSTDGGNEREIVYDVKISDNKIECGEHLNLCSGIWWVCIHGTKSENGEVVQRITTDSDMIAVVECGILDGEPLPLTPVSAAERIMALIGNLDMLATEARSDVVTALNELAAKLSSGEDGSDGVTFIPSVSADGVISWTNSGGLANPEPVNIKGPQGEPGAAGSDGKDGYTPVKGTDYFTAADKTEFVDSVLAALPMWNGGSY